jgi:hypothetical protein
MVKRTLTLLAVAIAVAGCKPDFGTPSSLVTEARILAVRAEPPEVRPTQMTTMTALVVSPDGTDANPMVDWSLCLFPKPLDENNVVSAACLDGGDGIQAVGSGPMVTATVPANACALFGPNPPPQLPGEPPLRPRDPDVTGGYYQPLRLVRDPATGFALERFICDLAQAGADLAVQYAMTYPPNTNPKLEALQVSLDGAPIELGAIPAGKVIDFAVSWPAEVVESFPVFELDAAALVTHRESMRVSWFATAGSFEHEVTGRGETEMETSTGNRWTAPTTPGPVHVWLVLRDSRGGIDYASYEIMVTP